MYDLSRSMDACFGYHISQYVRLLNCTNLSHGNLCWWSSLYADVVGASYYDSSLRWFENDGAGSFTEHLISNAVNEGQGVTLADLDK